MKLYVSSKSRATGTDSDFAISLPRPLVVRGKHKVFVDSVVLANSFYSVRSFENDQIYLREGSSDFRILTLPEGQYNAYSLQVAVQAALQGTGKTLAGNYTVQFSTVTQRLSISNDQPGTFHIYPGELLKEDLAAWNTPSFGAGGPLIAALRASDGVTGLTGSAILSGSHVLGVPIVAVDAVNIQPYAQLFLRSSLSDTTQVMTADGGSDIIRRVVVGQTPLNELCFDAHSTGYDSLDIKDRELNSIAFALTDSRGRVVNCRGHEVSFSCIFLPVEE
jgi:hypothetical protein